MRRVTQDQARRYALGAQGFNGGRATGRVDSRHFRKVVDAVGLIQLDSVNVFSRAHFMPFFSRIGPYDRDALDTWLWRSGELFEYWGHEASLIPSDQHRLFRWRMDQELSWKAMKRLENEQPGYIDAVLSQVEDRGPLQTKELEDAGERIGRTMWNWSHGKVALEALFLQGRITTAHRPNFTRMYDVPERVIAREHLDAPGPSREEAQRALLLQAARHMGVATADDLGDYYRIRMPQARPLVAQLVDRGDLVEVEVEGWDRPGFLHPETSLPRTARGTALLSPFDNLIWYRPRVERLWDFHYRIEIYVPEAKRVYGYYVLPFLMDGDLVARVDLKTDRQAGVLRVKGAFGEPGVDLRVVGSALREELELVAGWKGMTDIEIVDNGDLSAFLML
ncbi:MAG: crosslink repair DNA glycosylase YcaQ family protein [Actinomycetota bacterium]|nr:crosslink repair DNA glycosylase YcaQ family protein [Actinomycetota bacterium]